MDTIESVNNFKRGKELGCLGGSVPGLLDETLNVFTHFKVCSLSLVSTPVLPQYCC